MTNNLDQSQNGLIELAADSMNCPFCAQQAEIKFDNKYCSKEGKVKRRYTITCKNLSCAEYRDDDLADLPISLWNSRHKRSNVSIDIYGSELNEIKLNILTCPFCGNAPICNQNNTESGYYTNTSSFIACITDSCIRPRVYGTFLSKIYDIWMEKRNVGH